MRRGLLLGLFVAGAATACSLSASSPVDGGTLQVDVANGLPAIPVGLWQHVRMRANLATKTGEYWLNGVLAKSATIAPMTGSGTPRFRVGVIGQNPGTGCSVRADNVAVRVR